MKSWSLINATDIVDYIETGNQISFTIKIDCNIHKYILRFNNANYNKEKATYSDNTILSKKYPNTKWIGYVFLVPYLVDVFSIINSNSESRIYDTTESGLFTYSSPRQLILYKKVYKTSSWEEKHTINHIFHGLPPYHTILIKFTKSFKTHFQEYICQDYQDSMVNFEDYLKAVKGTKGEKS
ncbi:MAG: hypothetical protein ACW967_00460 [Candidatus Hodarchaeales archaeon]|jgi:hypothetical protein